MITFLFLPLAFVNLWHASLLAIAAVKGGLRQSISDSALTDMKLLWMHRCVHTLGALSFITYGSGLLATPKLQRAGIILIAAAVCDIVQSWTLSRQARAGSLDLHRTHVWTAWTMAAGYMLFALVSAYITHLDIIVVIVYGALLGAAYLWSKLSRHRYFWLAQMVFFVATSILIAMSGAQI